jgi:multidrug efflux pump subunit AcrB
MGFVQQQFFPASDRPELIVDWTLPQNASIAETKDLMDRSSRPICKAIRTSTLDVLCRAGRGALRALSFDVQPPMSNFGQVIIVTKGLEARERYVPG